MRFILSIFVSSIPALLYSAPPSVSSLAYHPKGNFLAAGSYRDVTLIDPKNGESIGKLSGHSNRITSLSFSNDGKYLAVASGEPSKSGEMHLYSIPETGLPKLERTWKAHQDIIYTMVFRTDGSILATSGYDRIIKLWNPVDGKLIRELKDHSDTVYGLAFHPEGKLLASVSADRAVKVWDVDTGIRLYTLSDPTDWVYAVTWSPNGKHLAAGGIDKSIRIWEANKDGGKLLHSVFAHNDAITKLIYASDGQILFSASEGKAIKSWNTTQMKEKFVFPAQTDNLLSVALHPNNKQLAVGRFDGVLSLLDPENGKVLFQPLPAKPILNTLVPNFAARGQTVRITFEGKELDTVSEVISNIPEVQGKIVGEKSATRLHATITIPKDAPIGSVELSLKSPIGSSSSQKFIVDRYPATIDRSAIDSARIGLKITLPSTVVGTIQKAGDADYYRFEAKSGEQIGVQALTSQIGSKLTPVLELTDEKGRVLVESGNGLLAYTCSKSGIYSLGIRDREFRGNKDLFYRMHIGDIPIVTHVFPIGVQRGTKVPITIHGVHLNANSTSMVEVPAQAAIGSRIPVSVAPGKNGEKPLGDASILVGEFPEIVRSDKSEVTTLPVPGTLNGIISKSNESHLATFRAKKGEQLLLEVNARRSGSPIDSFIEILDSKNKLVGRATLRCVARTFSTFRDHDSFGSGIRLEYWNELAMNDYLFVGNQLLRIFALPKGPDDDCQFYSLNGQRIGHLGTTPTQVSNVSPMYKVEIHPPGSTFPPNGMPVFTIGYRNDDGGQKYGKDSVLFFDPPADDEYRVRIGDSRNEGSANNFYRLTVRSPRPDYTISVSPSSPSVWKGGAIPITITASRIDSFNGPIQVQLENLPEGYESPITFIEAEQQSTTVALYAKPNAVSAEKAPPFKVVAKAQINGKEVVREVTGGLPKAIEPGDLVTTTNLSEVTIQPGKETKLLVTIERRNGFKGRVPVDVKGLPYGVRVLDIGLNGILITERDTAREVVLYAEPWVQPMKHPIVVLSRSERKGTEHAAKSVLLKVEK